MRLQTMLWGLAHRHIALISLALPSSLTLLGVHFKAGAQPNTHPNEVAQAERSLDVTSSSAVEPSPEYKALTHHLRELRGAHDKHDLVGGVTLMGSGAALAVGGGHFTYTMINGTEDCSGSEDGYCFAGNLFRVVLGVPLGVASIIAGTAGLSYGWRSFNRTPYEEINLVTLSEMREKKGEAAAIHYGRELLRRGAQESRARRFKWVVGYGFFTALVLAPLGAYWQLMSQNTRLLYVGGVTTITSLALYNIWIRGEAEERLERFQSEERGGFLEYTQDNQTQSVVGNVALSPLLSSEWLGLSIQGQF